jgi:hypothetical protein
MPPSRVHLIRGRRPLGACSEVRAHIAPGKLGAATPTAFHPRPSWAATLNLHAPRRMSTCSDSRGRFRALAKRAKRRHSNEGGTSQISPVHAANRRGQRWRLAGSNNLVQCVRSPVRGCQAALIWQLLGHSVRDGMKAELGGTCSVATVVGLLGANMPAAESESVVSMECWWFCKEQTRIVRPRWKRRARCESLDAW